MTENSIAALPDFRYVLRVRYSECDAQSVVFNSRYGDYVDVAITEYFRVLFGGFQELTKRGLDSQVVNLTTNWQSSAEFEQVLCLGVSLLHLGNSSFSLKVEFTEHGSERKIAVSQITYVMVDSKELQKTPIPDWIRIKLSEGADGTIVDHGS